MARFDRHIFTCVHTRDPADARGSCTDRGGQKLAEWFKAEGKKRGWRGRIRANRSGCLDACEFGPVVVVYPDQTWYSPTTEDDVRRICEEHIEGGVAVQDLLVPGLD